MRDEDDHRALLDAAKAWKQIKPTGQKLWNAWTSQVGPALAKARAEALDISGAAKPKGKGYNGAMSRILIEYKLADMKQVTRADLLSIMEYLEIVEAWRDQQKQRESLNHPTVVWRKFKSSKEWKEAQIALGLKPAEPPDNDDAAELKKLDKTHFTADEIADSDALDAKEHEIDELKAQLEAHRVESLNRAIDAGSRLPDPPAFDLSDDVNIETAVSSFIVLHGEEPSRKFANVVLSRCEPPGLDLLLDDVRQKLVVAGTIADKVDNWPFDARPHAKKVKKAIDVACNGIVKIRGLVPPEVGAQFAYSRQALQ
jgi:hypothetical protein